MNFEKLQYLAKYVVGIMIVVTVLLLSTVWMSSSSLESVRLEFQKSRSFDKGWYYEENGKRIPAGAADRFGTTEVTLYRTIPESLSDSRIIYFRNRYRAVEVRIDDEVVYRFGVDAHPLRNDFLGNFYCFIPVPAGGEREMAVRLINTPEISHTQLQMPEFMTGSQGEVIYTLLRGEMDLILFSIIMTAFAVALIVIAIVESARKRDEDSDIFLFAGVFILIATVWVVTDSPVLQLVYGNSEAVLNISFLSFMLMGIPMLSFVEAVCGRKVAGIQRLQIVFSANFLIQCALYVGNVFSFMKMIVITHILLITSIGYLFLFMIREYKRTKSLYAGAIVLALMVFCVVTGVSLTAFYVTASGYSGFFRIGLFAFSVILICISIMKIMEGHEARTKAKVYRFLAYTDAMTGLGNRMAFDQSMETIDSEPGTGKCIKMILMDLNGLKKVNDLYGHRTGDEIIKGMADCIRDTFEGLGKCYRIGGDEFVVILRGRGLKEDILNNDFQQTINDYNQKHLHKLSVAVGFASMEDLNEGRENMQELYRVADDNMYRMKESMHRERREKEEKNR